MLTLPFVPADEWPSVPVRIARKFEAFEAERKRGATNRNREQGELYEIAAAILLYYQRLIRTGRQLSRWQLPGETQPQSISMGQNNEYDFVAEDGGVLLGEAKSEFSGLGEYIKKAVSFCLCDRLVRGGCDKLAGFCFVTPRPAESLQRSAVANAIGILSGFEEASGISGMNSQLIPLAMKQRFRRYTPKDRAPQPSELSLPLAHYLAEIRAHAGIDIRVLTLSAVPEDRLREDVRRVVQFRWPG